MDYTDLYDSVDRNKCCIMDLLPLLIDIDTKTGNVHVSPSRFMNEMQLSTEQRLEKLNLQPRKINLHQLQTLKVHPEIVIFQNFKPGTLYTVPLKLINIKKLPIPIKLKMDPSPFFSVKHASDDHPSKIASGMSLNLEVNFSADDFKDYSHEITFYTERETFEVKLIAIGPRPLLDLPDKITLPTTAIDVQTEKTLLVRNLGKVSAKFVIETEPPFSIDRKRDTLKPDMVMQLTIYFTPTQVGYVKRNLTLRYETGEILSLTVDALAEEASVWISTEEIKFKDTFLGLTARVEVVIKNTGNYKLQYKWKRFEDSENEKKVKEDLKKKYASLKDYELAKSNRMDYYDITNQNENKLIYKRILNDEEEELDREDCLGFSDVNFVIHPMEGELWAQSEVDVSFVFAPKAVDSFEKLAFLQITGLLKRIPIKLSAQTLGPRVHLNVEAIDVQDIYIRAIHHYEIVFINTGPIPANIRYAKKPTMFGGMFECTEEEFLLEPKGNKNVQIQFNSEIRGKFVEEISFTIVDSGEPLRIIMTGRVISPLLNIDCSEIDFKNVPIGCEVSYDILLKNPSPVPIDFYVHVPTDGHQKAYKLENICWSDFERISVNYHPKQFTFKPERGEVEAYGQMLLTVTLLSNTWGQYVDELEVGMWNSRKWSKSIPIKYTSIYPELVCTTTLIEMRSMFINQPYSRIVTVENRSQFSGSFCATSETDDPSLSVSINKKCHLIEALDKVDLRVIISSDELGSCNGSLSIHQFGAREPQTICKIMTKTRGPSIDINCESIAVGEIPTLTLFKRVIPISNDSPIRAHITFICTGEFLSTQEQEIFLEPEETGSFVLQLMGTIPGPFRNTLTITVQDGVADTYPVTGTCVGGSILCEPKLEPMYELGTILTEQEFIQNINLTNKGKELHIVYFSQHAFLSSFKKVVEPPSIVKIVPRELELKPNECKTMTIKTMSKIPCELNAIFYMHTKRETMSKCGVVQFYVQASFEEPTIAYNKNSFSFYMDVGVDEERKFLRDTLTLLNRTNTELPVRITIDRPFFILDSNDFDKNVHNSMSIFLKEKKVFEVIFEPPTRNRKCFTISGFITIYYKDHPKVDKISLEGKVNYPDIVFQSMFLDFERIPKNSSIYQLILMKNVSPLKATFNFRWLLDNNYLEVVSTEDKETGPDLSENKIKQTLNNERSGQSTKTTSEEELHKEKDMWLSMQHLLIPLVEQFLPQIDYDFYKKFLEKEELPFIYKIVDIVPTKGCLDPFESQYLSVNVRPLYNQSIKARLTCQILGGETEVVTLMLEAGDISYSMNGTTIDFGIVPFNEICAKEHDLENTGRVAFEYMIGRENVWFEFKPVPHWLNIYPQHGTLKSAEKVSIVVDYFPGVVGYFHEKVQIDIGYSDTMELDIVGCAVFPQVYFNLPRPYFESNYMNLMSYGAIRELIRPEHCNLIYEASKAPEPYFEDWVTITPKEKIPSVVDISMALERRLIKKFLLENRQVVCNCFYNPSAFIPCTYVPYYFIDFGYVCVDSIQQVELSILHYNPYATKLIWPKLSNFIMEKGFTLFMVRGNPHRFLLFTPKSKFYKDFEEKMQFSFHVIVRGGLQIEFQVSTIVTRPKLEIRHEIIKFGEVKCGNCLKRTIILLNSGSLPCEWSASLESQKQSYQHFYILQTKGSLDVGEKCLLDIYFEPHRHGKIVRKLVLTVAYAEDVVAVLKGFGAEPTLDILEARNVFIPTIPYSLHNKITTTLTNWCPYPIEVYFAEFDRQSQLEDEVVWTLCHYYDVSQLYVKSREVGDPLPEELVTIYYTIIDKLRQHLVDLIQTEFQRQLEELGSNPDEDVHISESSTAKAALLNEIGGIPDPLQNKSTDELKLLLRVNMKKLRDSDIQTCGDINGKMAVFDEKPIDNDDMTKRKEGVLLIFYGAPNTNFVQAANRTARILQLPVYGIDQLIFEALISNESLAAIKVNEEINKAFLQAASDSEMTFAPDFDPYDELQRKIELIVRGKKKVIDLGKKKDKGKGKKGKKGSPYSSEKSSSKGSKKGKDVGKKGKKKTPDSSGKSSKKGSKKSSGKGSGKTKNASFLGISNNIFFEMIKSELETFEHGLVIESLASFFVNKPHDILLNILTSVGHIRYIQFVYYSSTYDEYVTQKRVALEEEELLTPAKQKRVRQLLKMHQEEFDTLAEDDIKLFRKYVIQPRKLESLRKRELLIIKRKTKSSQESKQVEHAKEEKHKDAKEKVVSEKTTDRSTSSGKSKRSEKSSKKSLKGSKKSTRSSLDEHELNLLAAEKEFFFIQHILEYWDRKNGKLLKPLPDGPPKEKKATVSTKSLRSKGSSKKGSSKGSKAGSKKGGKKNSKDGSKKGGKKNSKDSSKKGARISVNKESKEEVPVEPPKIQVKILSDIEALVREYTGVHLIVMSGQQLHNNFAPDYLSELEELTTALKLLAESKLPKFEETEKMYTILRPNPINHSYEISDVFIPYDTPVIPETESISSKNNYSSVGTSTSDNSSSKKTRERSKSYDKSETSSVKQYSAESSADTLQLTFTHRLILQANEKVSYDFYFLPKKCGEFAHTYHLKIVSCGRRFPIRLEGKADIPRIYTDLEMMFPSVFDSRYRHEFESGYLKDEDLFNFGPVFAQSTETPISCLFGEEQFNIISKSYVPSIVFTEFLEASAVFSVNYENNGMLIYPNNSQFLQLSAHPRMCGPYQSDLIITIRNNPAVYIIRLFCIGSEYDIEFIPKDIFFERVLLDVIMTKQMVLKNKGMLAVNWMFHDTDDVFCTFQPSTKKGFLRPQSKQTVRFELKMSKLVEVPKMKVDIEFYDKDMKLEDPIISDVLKLSVEIIDILIEYVPQIDLQEQKVNVNTAHNYKLVNKSKYDLNYSIEMVTHPNEDKQDSVIKNYFSIEGSYKGTLKVQYPHEVKIKFHPKKPVEFSCLPLFTFRFFDAVDSREVHKFDLKVSAKVYGSSFKLCPPNEINFGHQMIKTEVSKEIVLKNSGKYSFTYAILSMAYLQKLKKGKQKGKAKKGGKKSKSDKSKKRVDKKKTKSKKSSKSSKTSKSSKSSKGSKSSKSKSSTKGSKHKVPKPTTLKEGIFSLVSSTGKIEPNNVEVIKISCKPMKVGEYEEAVVFYISEAVGKTKNGQTLTLKAQGCIPKVDTSNFDEMFKEIRVLDKFNDVTNNDELLMYPIFVMESKELYFKKTCLNISAEIRMKLINTGLITAAVSCKVIEGGPVFSVQPTILHIDPYKSEYVEISFKPVAIEKFHGILEIDVLPDPKKSTINLTGEGCLPEITMLKPEKDTIGNSYSINFNPLMIGSSACRTISFKNTGVLPCKVLVGLQNDENGMFFLVPKEYPTLLQKLCDQEYLLQEFNHTVVIELKPGETSILDLQFKPSSEVMIKSFIKLYIIDNPFEMVEIFISAEGYKEDIVIEGLETMNLLSPNSSLDNSLSLREENFKQLYYELNFGYCFINKLHKICFRIKNISEEDTYKFSFMNLDKLTFLPAVGHLKPLACKEVIVAIYSKVPVLYDKIIIECRLCKIKYLSPEHEPLSWDERQHFTIWKPMENGVPRSSAQFTEEYDTESPVQSTKVKTIQERTEPPIEEISDSEKNIKIYFSVVLDYCSYSCDVNDINIEDTLLFEKRSSTFVVTNTSDLPIVFKWDLPMSENYPRPISADVSEEFQSICRSRPQTGYKKQKPVYLLGNEIFFDPISARPKSSHTSVSTGFSASTEGNMFDSWTDYHLNPFTIEPSECTILPGNSLTYTITFSPFEVFEYAINAQAKLLNLKPGIEQPKITIRAKSLLPLYHFNIKPSNYLKVRRENRDTCGYVVNESTKIVEFESIGIGVPIISKFTIINPTGQDFSFKWERSTKGNLSLFQCQTPKGFVSKGKMAEAIFAFMPTRIGVSEALYVFFIEKYNLRTDFLLVGRAREPSVYFKKQSVMLKPTVIGIEIFDEIVLKNDESVDLKFNFKKLSLYSEGRLQKVRMVPFKSTIGGRSEETIRIHYNPSQLGPVTFNVECKIEKMEKPLVFLLEGNCFEVQPVVTYQADFSIIELDYTQIDVFEFSSLIPLREDNLCMKISNVGRVGFYYKWELMDKFSDDFIKIDFLQKEGYMKTGTTAENGITIKPNKHLTKKNVPISLKIAYGPTYTINLLCSTCRTKIKLSFREYDFGTCLVQTSRTYFYETTLKITNNDPSPVTIDTENEIYDHLTIINKANSIPPKKSGTIIFYFHPIQVQTYETEVTLIMNGKVQKVVLFGEGVPLDIEVVDPADKLINLGPVSIGKSKRRTVRVVNKSRCPVNIGFELLERMMLLPLQRQPVLEADFERPEMKVSDIQLTKEKAKKRKKNAGKKAKKRKGSKGSKKSSKSSGTSNKKSKKSKKSKKHKDSSGTSKSSARSKSSKSSKSSKVPETKIESAEEREKRLIYQFVKINPIKFVKLFPEQVTDFTISYSPTERMPLFTDKVYYQVQYERNPICMFKTSCLGPEFYLDQKKISFGTVVKGCSSEEIIKLFNIGDVGGKYKWNISKKLDAFWISPREGYITPNMAVTFTVKFSPTYTHCLFRVMAHCIIENFKPLNLELLGTCIQFPPPKQTLTFRCQVRERDQKKVSLKNPTGYDWTITPSLSGQYFDVDKSVIVKSASSAEILVYYHPLTMTQPNRKHESKLFFPLPEGQGILFNLIGETTIPKTLQKIERNIIAKSYHTEPLEVKNWLRVQQQFAVINQIDQSEKPVKVLYKLSGNSVIDVPPSESRTYKWIIYPLNEGKLQFKVKFRNLTTNEYLVYEIVLTITKCISLEVIKLTTCARQKAQHKIILQNPIKQPDMFTITTTCPDLYFKNVLHIAPYTTEELLVEYAPIVAAKQYTTSIEAKTNTLGTFPYTFILTALPAQPEAAIYFQAQLGVSDMKTVYLYNYQEKKADFTSKIQDPQFSIDQPVSIPSKVKGAIQLTFEPDNLGGFNSKITLTSPTLGEFTYPLIGNCIEPKPIGPYLIKEGAPTAITFKNPFNVQKKFNFSIESPHFYVKNNIENIRAKGTIKIYTGLAVATSDTEYPLTGKLFVSCDDDDLPNVKWIMYLKTEN